MALYEQVKLLYKNALYKNVVDFATMVVTLSENQGESSIPCHRRYHTMVMLGFSIQQLKQFRRAEFMLKKAMLYAKSLLKSKIIKATDVYTDGMTEIDVKLAMAECHLSLGQRNQALSVLESVAPRTRTARLNMMLGELYQQTGMERPAVTAYKEVLKECPCAVVAAEKLLELGVSGTEVVIIMMATTGADGQSSAAPEWLTAFVKGLASRCARDFNASGTTLRQLEEGSGLRNNAHLMATLGATYYLQGDERHALTILERAHALDPLSLEAVDMLGTLYYTDKRVRDLELLAAAAVNVTETSATPWILLAYYCHLSKKSTKAIYFAHKACSLDPFSVEGLLLKGTLLLELKKLQEAALHFKEAMQIAPSRFEPYQGLVDSYMAMHRNRDAVTVASNATKLLGQTARSLTLYASVLLKDAMNVNKGKSVLEKAIKEEPYYLPAVFLLCDIYSQERRWERAIELLSRQLSVQGGCRLHERLADLYSKQYRLDESNYHHALAAKYANQGEVGGVCAVGGGVSSGSGVGLTTSGGLEPPHSPQIPQLPPFDMEVEDINDSEGDVELSDLEAVWSDGDFSFTGQ
uniref:Anaphase-promoting complex subunit 7-like n=2 Tax=Hirondellea gigas TaxID=1518452 RepID=A0A6A7G3T2_9CRUS